MGDDFLSRLRAAREAATPTPWEFEDNGGNYYISAAEWQLTCLLVNNTEKIEQLIEAGEITAHRAQSLWDSEYEGTRAHAKYPNNTKEWDDALAALDACDSNGGEE